MKALQLNSVHLVGGTFDLGQGKASGLVNKLYQELVKESNAAGVTKVNLINGGNYQELANLVEEENTFGGLVIWMPNIDNKQQKLLPLLMQKNPNAFLVQSKLNNGRYSKEELIQRMRQSSAELLLEFNTQGLNKAYSMSLHSVAGASLIESSTDVNTIVNILLRSVTQATKVGMPLSKNEWNALEHNQWPEQGYASQVGFIPTSGHPGGFGTVRKHHRHEGVDLYAQEGEEVYAIEAGTVVFIRPFTGEQVGSPWWENTFCVGIQGNLGVFNYGEILVIEGLNVGDSVGQGQAIGSIKRVLKKDKGTPTSMLHLERYSLGTQEPISEWSSGEDRPAHLINPTAILLNATRKFK